MKRIKYVTLLLCSLPVLSFTQTAGLEIIGTAEADMKPLENARATLLKDGKIVQTATTKSDGTFIFQLEMNNEYLIEVEKSGLLKKRIAFNTEIPAEVTGKWTMEFAMTLYKSCDGVNTSVLSDPVDRIKYSSSKSDFISDENYVMTMRGRLDKLQQDIDICFTKSFQDKMEEGDQLAKNGQFEEAAKKYEEALKVFPDNKTAIRKLNESKISVGESQQKQKKYDAAVAEANRLLTAKDIEAARAKYAEALKYNPSDTYAKAKLAELDQTLAARQQANLNKQKTESEYSSLMSQANTAYNSKDFEKAKSLYAQALDLKPDSPLPKQKIAEIDPLIARQKQEQLQKQAGDLAYQEAMDSGEKAYLAGDYQSALQYFNKANTLKPEESQARQKINEINKIIDQQRTANLQAEKVALRKKIEDALDEGDALLARDDFAGAEAAFMKALQLDPNDTYAKQQVNKAKTLQINATAQKQKTIEKAYASSVDDGDKLLAAASYEQAIEAYKQALLQKPGDISAKTKLAEAEQKLAAEQQRKASDQEKRKKYDKFLADGNNYFTAKQYDAAKSSYNSAMMLYPDQSYPRTKIDEIDRLLALEQKQKHYSELISKADGLLLSKDYLNAKITYQQALGVKPEESYPRQRIAEADAAIKANQKLVEEQKLRDAQYSGAIQEADGYLSQKKYAEAQASYKRSLALKPSETYPQQQIDKIEGILAEQLRKENELKSIEQQYSLAISKADQLYNTEQWVEAKDAYLSALRIKQGQAHPVQRIGVIDAKLQQIEKENQQRAAFEQRYNTVISIADKAYEVRNYSAAKAGYTEALKLKPTDKYPQERLNKIAEFERSLALQESRKKVTATTNADQTSSKAPPKLAALKFANDSERDKYLNGLKKAYPAGVTLELYKEKTSTTYRYVVIRAEEVREFRKVVYTWGGVDFSLNGIPISGDYLETQVKVREGEFFQEIEF